MSFVGIYDADGTVVGELRYAVGKLLKQNQCALCDITHGWNPLGSKSWKEACQVSSVELELIHRNEATAEQLNATTGLPSILRYSDDRWSEALSPAEIADFVGAPDELLSRLAQL